DTDTVGCITGGLAGARYSIGAIPARWTTGLHGNLIGRGDSGIRLEHLETMAGALLAGRSSTAGAPPTEAPIEPTRVWDDDIVYAANFPGVVAALDSGRLPADALVISLSRTFRRLDDHRSRRQVWLIDQNEDGRNLAIQDILDDVIDTIDAAAIERRPVVVHCHGGRSRTGLVLKAWLLRKRPELTLAEATADVATRWPHLDTWNSSFDDALDAWVARGR
ncbi:MAG: dual specificity protein phosphatase family protein, partial [Acidimicrobiales bacterium]